MAAVHRVSSDSKSPKLRIVDTEFGSPHEWVSGTDKRYQRFGEPEDPLPIVRAVIDRSPQRREFCALVPGTLVIPESEFEDEDGVTSMYYALWKQTRRVTLRCGEVDYACFIPKLVLGPDPSSGAPCPIRKLYASVFRIEGCPPTEVYCTSGVVSSGDEFPYVYKKEGFTGLSFETIWEGL